MAASGSSRRSAGKADPGEIGLRELENAVVRAAALCDQIVRPEDLPERVQRSVRVGQGPLAPVAQSTAGNGFDNSTMSLAEIERNHIMRVLAHTAGNKQAASRILGIDRTTLQRKLERYELDNGSANGSS